MKNGLGKCGCRCAGNTGLVQLVSLVPYNFYRQLIAGKVSGSIGTNISSTPKIGETSPILNSVKFLTRKISIYEAGNVLIGYKLSRFDRTTGVETILHDDSIALSGSNPNYINLFTSYATIPYGVYAVTATDSFATLYLFSFPAFDDGKVTIELTDPVTYADATSDAAALLSNATLLAPASGYTAIKPADLRTTGLAAPAAGTELASAYRSLLICYNTQVATASKTAFVNWPGTGVQLIENNQCIPTTWQGGQRLVVAARGVPVKIGYPFSSADSSWLEWPPSSTGNLLFPIPTSTTSAPANSTYDFVACMSSAFTFASGIDSFVEQVYDPLTNSSVMSPLALPALLQGQHIFLPSDLGAAFGVLAAVWGAPALSTVAGAGNPNASAGSNYDGGDNLNSGL
jgi:hypothetical protein